MFVFLLLIGCRKPCDPTALASASSPAEVYAACRLNPNQMTSPQCSPGPQKRGYDELISLHQQCKLEAIHKAEEFALAKGDPVGAAVVYEKLQASEVSQPQKYTKIVLGESPYTGLINFPRLTSWKPNKPEKIAFWDQDLQQIGQDGPLPQWHISIRHDGSIAMDRELTIRSLRFLVASNTSPQNPLQLVFLSDQLTTVSIFPPSDADIPVINDMSTSTTAKRIRIDLPNRATIQDLGDLLSHYPNKEIELAIDHAPCYPSTHGMRCVAGNKSHSTFYIDKNPPTQKLLQHCYQQKICASTHLNWFHAAQICHLSGKRLPTRQEFQAAGIKATAWSNDWNSKLYNSTCKDIWACAKKAKKRLSNGQALPPGQRLQGALYCASDRVILGSSKPVTKKPSSHLKEPTKQELQIAHQIKPDPISEKPICNEAIRATWGKKLQQGGRAHISCRDPLSYLVSNEPYRHVVTPYLPTLGGGYIGIGAAQNYDFIALTRPEWVWLTDNDPNIQSLHLFLRAVVKASPTPQKFFERIQNNPKDIIEKILSNEFEEQQAKELVGFYYRYRGKLTRGYFKAMRGYYQKDFGWLAKQSNYQTIRDLLLQNRIVVVKADLMGKHAFKSIAEAANNLQTPIRTTYLSDAPTSWGGRINASYRQNMKILPIDERSLIIATYPQGKDLQKPGYWLHIVANARVFIERMQITRNSWQIIWDRLPGHRYDINLLRLPGQPPTQSPAKPKAIVD